jgi:hypothetical protein
MVTKRVRNAGRLIGSSSGLPSEARIGELMDGDDATLADAVDVVRAQLAEARRRAADADQDVRFQVGDVTVEFGVELTRQGSGQVGLALGVVTVSIGGGKSHQASHKITINLTPHAADGTNIDISDDE